MNWSSNEAIRQTLYKLQDCGVHYFISGGVALDVLRGNFTRAHKDLDTYVFDEDIKELFQRLKDDGYTCYRKLNKYEVHGKDIVIDVLPLQLEGDQRIIIGNSADSYYPAELFNKDTSYAFEGGSVSLIPVEILFFEGQYSNYPDDRLYVGNLRYDGEAYGKIRSIPKEKPSAIELEKL